MKDATSGSLEKPSEVFVPCTGRLAFSRTDIAKLSPIARNLALGLGMPDPGLFLASVQSKGWRPCVVAVSQGERIVGVLYCKERTLAGIGTRLVVGNDTWGTMVVASPEEMELVMRSGVESLLKQMVGLRILVAPDRLPLLTNLHVTADIDFWPAPFENSHLKLPGTYDEFLCSAGPRTRRNLRYYRRKSVRAGNEFISGLAFSDFCAAARNLCPKSSHKKAEQELKKSLAIIESMPSRMLVGLHNSGGEWISLAGGWYIGNRAVMNLQLNDETYSRESLSLTLRSHLIEELINRGSKELVFKGGNPGPLRLLCSGHEQFIACFDSPSIPWRLFRSVCVTLNNLTRRSFSAHLQWIIGSGVSKVR
jgi:hypothetical protein